MIAASKRIAERQNAACVIPSETRRQLPDTCMLFVNSSLQSSNPKQSPQEQST